MRKYKLIYTDKFGEETTEISSDGSMMYLTLRGIAFEGTYFEGLGSEIDESKFEYFEFEDGSGDLTNFRMKITFPINLYHQQKIITEKITFTIVTGNVPEMKNSKDNDKTVILDTSFGQFTSTEKMEDFESSLIEIQNKLPEYKKYLIVPNTNLRP